jgi:hypothetical protein
MPWEQCPSYTPRNNKGYDEETDTYNLDNVVETLTKREKDFSLTYYYLGKPITGRVTTEHYLAWAVNGKEVTHNQYKIHVLSQL